MDIHLRDWLTLTLLPTYHHNNLGDTPKNRKKVGRNDYDNTTKKKRIQEWDKSKWSEREAKQRNWNKAIKWVFYWNYRTMFLLLKHPRPNLSLYEISIARGYFLLSVFKWTTKTSQTEVAVGRCVRTDQAEEPHIRFIRPSSITWLLSNGCHL